MIVCSTSNLNNIDKATPTNYQLVFPLIPTETSIAANNPFVMNIFSAVIPSLSIPVNEVSWQGNKVKYDLNPLEFETWLVNFTVDSRLDNWELLFNWMCYINNNYNKIAEYHSEYSVDASMIITNNYGKAVMEIVFVDIWPTQLSEIAMSQREGDIVLESMVTFQYDYFYVRSTAWTEEFSSSSKSSSSKSFDSSSSTSESSSSSSSSSSFSSSSSSLSQSSSSSSSSTSTYAAVARWSEFDKGNEIQVVDFGRTAKNLADQAWRTIIAEDGASTGKVYFELTNFTNDTLNDIAVGWQKKKTNINDYDYQFELGQSIDGLGWRTDSGDPSYVYFNSGQVLTIDSPTGEHPFDFQDTVGLAADIDQGRFWFRTSEGWYPDHPASGSGYQNATFQSQEIYPAVGMYGFARANGRQQALIQLNSGLLEFQYAIPAGFTAIQSSIQEERDFLTLKSTPLSDRLYMLSSNLTILDGKTGYDGGSAPLDITPKNSGKWYFEVEMDLAINDNTGLGWSSIISPTSTQLNVRPGQNVGDLGAGFSSYNRIVAHNGTTYNDYNVNQSAEWRAVFGCAIDIDNGRIWFGSDRDGSGVAGDLGYMNWSGDPEAGTGGWTFPAMAGQTLIPWVYALGSDFACRTYGRFHPEALRYRAPSGFNYLEGDYDTVWDENNKYPTITISENGTRASKPNEDHPNDGPVPAIYGKMARGEGKKYIEFVLNEDAIYRLRFGICTETLSISAALQSDIRRAVSLGTLVGDRRIIEWGPGSNDFEYNISWIGGPAGTVIGIAINFRTGDVWVHKDGTWYDDAGTAGDPENELNPVITLDKIYKMKPFIYCGAGGHVSGDNFDITMRTRDSEYQYKPTGWSEW